MKSPSRKRSRSSTVDYAAMLNQYDEEDFESDEPVVKRQRVSIAGRSNSAPPVATLAHMPVKPPNSPAGSHGYTVRVPDPEQDADWTNAAHKAIRLPYYGLDPTDATRAYEGVLVAEPAVQACTDGEVLRHFAAVTAMLKANYKTRDATEATGEAAAALYVLKTPAYSGYWMVWGLGVHGGKGIDQIWYKPGSLPNGRNGSYLIVEAKGVGAQLTDKNDPDVPTPVQQQMSIGWVYDRLVSMTGSATQATVELATELLDDVGLKVLYQNDNKILKKAYYQTQGGRHYHNCTYKGTATSAELKGIVVEAAWGQNGEFQGMLRHSFDYHV